MPGETVWQGVVEVEEDVFIPAGSRLTVMAGTVVKMVTNESTKIDPEYLSHLTEIVVRGELQILGTEKARVIIMLADHATSDAEWAGIIVDGGKADLKFVSIRDAEAAVTVIQGNLSMQGVELTDNRYGLVGYGSDTTAVVTDSVIEKNDYGMLLLSGSHVKKNNLRIKENRKKDVLIPPGKTPPNQPTLYVEEKKELTRSYKDETLPGITIWNDRILIEGIVRVPPEGRLIIMPGTVIEFTKRDTNGDGIGENGIMIQGQLMAKGTPAAPIIFRSAEAAKSRGDWDSINILGSDQAQNLVEYCQIQDAYRGLHSHYSSAAVSHAILVNNYRGIQFQESRVFITDSIFYDNKSAIQCRDSQVDFKRNRIITNLIGANFFRLDATVKGNLFSGNAWDGLRIREGTVEVAENTMTLNRYGLLIADARFGTFRENIIVENIETGIALRNSENVEIRGNAVGNNGLAGIIIRDSLAAITENLISGNGERGIGIISFAGSISNNNLEDNGLYAIGLEGSGEVDARRNWWGKADLKDVIYDRHDDQMLGEVFFEPVLESPFSFHMPAGAPDQR